jgi:outer membrane autotransporter protein
LGFSGAMELNPVLFFESGILFGLGVPGRQNSYLAIQKTIGARLGSWLGAEWVSEAGLYVEVDTRERFDSRYDASFSAPGRTDRIRASKMGYLVGVDSGWGNGWSTGARFVQKLGGYDAPATQAFQFKLGRSF